MKWKELIKSKKMLSVLLLATAAVALIFVTYAMKHTVVDSEQQGHTAIASVQDVQEQALALLDGPEPTQLKPGRDYGRVPGSRFSLEQLLAKSKRFAKNETHNRTRQSDDNMGLGKFFQKNAKTVFLADNSDGLLLLAKNDEGEPEGYENPGPEAEGDWLEPLNYLGPGADGGSASGERSTQQTTQIRSSCDTDPKKSDPDTPSPVPEPSTMILIGSGLVGLASMARKIRKP